MMRIVCLALGEWQAKHDGVALSSVQFDKLVVILHRSWDALARQGAVRFRSPFLEARGTHGPGCLVQGSDNKNRYFSDLVRTLGVNYFQFSTVERKVDGTDPSRVETGQVRLPVEVRLGIVFPPTPRDFLGLEPNEADFAIELLRAVSSLSAEEIRALGTHKNQHQTIEAVDFELERIENAALLQVMSEALDSASDVFEPARDLRRYLWEVVRKSGRNRATYETARAKLLAELGTPPLRGAALETYAAGSAIWDVDHLAQTFDFASNLHPVVDYVARFSGAALTPVSQVRELEALDRAATETARRLGCAVPNRPADRTRLFDKERQEKIRACLASAGSDLRRFRVH